MDTLFKPILIKIEDDDDLEIDLESAMITPEKRIAEWDKEIRKKIFKQMLQENERFLDDLMLEYIKSLKEKLSLFDEKKLLRDKVLMHIKFFYFCYLEMRFIESSNYLENMEDILTIYCNLELEIVRHLKKCSYNKLEVKQTVKDTCRKISYVLSTYLMNKEIHILHVLIKMDNVPNIPTCRSVMNVLYTHYLIEFPTQDLSDEAFCRSYILFQKWKQICKSEEHAVMDKTMYFRYKQTPESVEKNKILKCVITPNSSTVDFVSQLFDWSNWSAEAYFNFIKSKHTIENEPDCINLIIEDDGDMTSLDADDFNKSLNEVVNSFSSKISQEPMSKISHRNGQNSKNDEDCVVVLDDTDSDCIEISDLSDSDAPVFVIDDQLDDDIEEIMFFEARSKDHRKRNRNRRKRLNSSTTVSLTSFLDSIPDILPTTKTKGAIVTSTCTTTEQPAVSNAGTVEVATVSQSTKSNTLNVSRFDLSKVKCSEATCVKVPVKISNETEETCSSIENKTSASLQATADTITNEDKMDVESKKSSVETSVQCVEVSSNICVESYKLDSLIAEKTDSSTKTYSGDSDSLKISDNCADTVEIINSESTLNETSDSAVDYTCKKCTYEVCCVNAKMVHSRTVQIQTDIDNNSKNCTYNYGIVTPPSEHHSTESQTVQDSFLNFNPELDDLHKTPQQSPNDDIDSFSSNFNNVKQVDDFVTHPYITGVCSLNIETSHVAIPQSDSVPEQTSPMVPVQSEEELDSIINKNVQNKKMEADNNDLSTNQSTFTHSECVQNNDTVTTDDGNNCIDPEVGNDGECNKTDIVDAPVFTNLETVQVPVDVHLNSAKTDIVETVFSLAENEMVVDNIDIETHKIVVQDTNELIFNSEGVCQNVFYLIDGHLVPCNNITETNVEFSASDPNGGIETEKSETLRPEEKQLCTEQETTESNIEHFAVDSNKHVNGKKLPQRQGNVATKQNEEKIMFTSVDTVKTISSKKFNNPNDLEDFTEVLSSPVTRINGVTSNQNFFNTGHSDLHFASDVNVSKSANDSRSNSPIAPAYDDINDFEKYYQQKMKLNLFPDKNTDKFNELAPVNNRKLKGTLNKKRSDEIISSRSNGITKQLKQRLHKRKSDGEGNSQSKRCVKFYPVVSSYEYCETVSETENLLSSHNDPKLVKLKPIITLPKLTEEELLKKLNVKLEKKKKIREREKRKRNDKLIFNTFPIINTKSQILERVVFDKTNKEDIKVIKVSPSEPYVSPLNLHSHRTVPSPLIRTYPGINNPVENSRKTNLTDGYKATKSVSMRTHGRPRRNNATESTSRRKPTKRKQTTDPNPVSHSSSFSFSSIVNSNSYFNQPVRPIDKK